LIEATFATPLSDPFASYEILGSNDAPDPLSIVWADNEEKQDSGRLDFSLPRTLWGGNESVFKAGAAAESTTRDVQGDAIFFSNPTTTLSNATPNGLYDELVSNPTTPVNSFSTQASAARDIRAAYVGATVPLVPRLKAVAGSRFEDYQLSVSGEGQWGNYRSSTFYSAYDVLGSDPSGDAAFRSKVWYPGVGLIWEPVEKVAVRIHYSETSGRPSLREVSPFFNKSIETGNLVLGNPALKPSDVSSYDLRVEWNPTPSDAVAVSLFRKDIRNPIEKLLFNTTAQTSEFTESWVNNPNTADLTGVEFELRHDLSRWDEALAGFSVGGNFTWIDASVAENPYVIQRASQNFQDPDAIPRERRLFDQPEYIANIDLTWNQPRWGTTITVAGYAISDVLETAGLLSSTYDLYQRSTTRLDLIVSERLTKNLKLKISAKNLTDPVHGTVYDREATEGTVERTRYRSGRDFSLSLTAEF
jgi:TonB-dependent receptor